MNYDQTNIPACYDRGRNLDPETLDLWMRALEAHVDGLMSAGFSTSAAAPDGFPKRSPATSPPKSSGSILQ